MGIFKRSNNKPQTVSEKTEENYGFIKEERVPQSKWQKKKKILRSVLIVILLAALAGIIFRISFEISDYVIQNVFNKEERKPVDITVPTPDAQITPGGTTPVVDDRAFNSYENMLKGVQLAAEALDPCLTTVCYVKEIIDPVFADVTENVTKTSGVIIYDNGIEYIVMTSYEAYEAAEHDKINVLFVNGKKAEADIYAKNQEADILLLAVRYAGFLTAEKEAIKIVPFSNSTSGMRIGSVVIALGFPNGKGKSVDFGIVTSRSKKEYITDASIELFETNMIGGRGENGILLNSKGQLVGFITNKFHDGGNCMEAINLDSIRYYLGLLINQKQYPVFGVTFSDLEDETLTMLSLKNGVLIESVHPDSQAFEQEFRQGDIITEILEQPIVDAANFYTLFTSFKEGEEITVTFQRNGKEMTKTWKVRY